MAISIFQTRLMLGENVLRVARALSMVESEALAPSIFSVSTTSGRAFPFCLFFLATQTDLTRLFCFSELLATDSSCIPWDTIILLLTSCFDSLCISCDITILLGAFSLSRQSLIYTNSTTMESSNFVARIRLARAMATYFRLKHPQLQISTADLVDTMRPQA